MSDQTLNNTQNTIDKSLSYNANSINPTKGSATAKMVMHPRPLPIKICMIKDIIHCADHQKLFGGHVKKVDLECADKHDGLVSK